MISKHDSSVIQTQYAKKCSEVFQTFKNMFSIQTRQFLFVSLVSKSVCCDHNSFIKHLRQLLNNQKQKIMKQGYVIIGNSALILNYKKNKKSKIHGEARLLDPTGTLRSKIGLSNPKGNPEDLNILSELKDAFYKACPMNEECTLEMFSYYIPCTLFGHNCSGLISQFYQENTFRIKVVYEEVFPQTDENTALERLKSIDIQHIPSHTNTPLRSHNYNQANRKRCNTSPRKEGIMGESKLRYLNGPSSDEQTTTSNTDVGILSASKEADRESFGMSMNMRHRLTTVPPVGGGYVDNPETVASTCREDSGRMLPIIHDKVVNSPCFPSKVQHLAPDIDWHAIRGSIPLLQRDACYMYINVSMRNCSPSQDLHQVDVSNWLSGLKTAGVSMQKAKRANRPPRRNRNRKRLQRKDNKKISKRMRMYIQRCKVPKDAGVVNTDQASPLFQNARTGTFST